MTTNNDRDENPIAARDCCAFASDLHKNIALKSSGNFVHSPLAVHAFLSYIFHAFKESIADEFVTSLRLSDVEKLDSDWRDLILSICDQGTTEKTKLHVANVLFIQEDFSLEESFENKGADFYGIEIKKMNLRKKDASDFINIWFSTRTDHLIRYALAQADAYYLERPVMVSSVIFGQRWKNMFSIANVSIPSIFNVNENLVHKVVMMSMRNTFSRGEIPSLNSIFLEIPYEDYFNMIVILPNDIDGLKNVEENFDWNAVIDAKRTTELISLYLPKFRVVAKHNLEKILPLMGMSSMFKIPRDLKKTISKDCDSSPKEVLQKVNTFIQKIILTVDEVGSGYPWTLDDEFYMATPKPSDEISVGKDFIVDRPFIAAVRHIESNIPLLIASVREIGDPQK